MGVHVKAYLINTHLARFLAIFAIYEITCSFQYSQGHPGGALMGCLLMGSVPAIVEITLILNFSLHDALRPNDFVSALSEFSEHIRTPFRMAFCH